MCCFRWLPPATTPHQAGGIKCSARQRNGCHRKPAPSLRTCPKPWAAPSGSNAHTRLASRCLFRKTLSCCAVSATLVATTMWPKVRSTPQLGVRINTCPCRCCSCAKTTASASACARRKAGWRSACARIRGFTMWQATGWICCLPLLPPAKLWPIAANGVALCSCICARCACWVTRVAMWKASTASAAKSRLLKHWTHWWRALDCSCSTGWIQPQACASSTSPSAGAWQQRRVKLRGVRN